MRRLLCSSLHGPTTKALLQASTDAKTASLNAADATETAHLAIDFHHRRRHLNPRHLPHGHRDAPRTGRLRTRRTIQRLHHSPRTCKPRNLNPASRSATHGARCSLLPNRMARESSATDADMYAGAAEIPGSGSGSLCPRGQGWRDFDTETELGLVGYRHPIVFQLFHRFCRCG